MVYGAMKQICAAYEKPELLEVFHRFFTKNGGFAAFQPGFGPKMGRDIAVEDVLGRKIPVLNQKIPGDGGKIPVLGRKLPRDGRKIPVLGGKIPGDGQKIPVLNGKLPVLGEQMPGQNGVQDGRGGGGGGPGTKKAARGPGRLSCEEAKVQLLDPDDGERAIRGAGGGGGVLARGGETEGAYGRLGRLVDGDGEGAAGAVVAISLFNAANAALGD